MIEPGDMKRNMDRLARRDLPNLAAAAKPQHSESLRAASQIRTSSMCEATYYLLNHTALGCGSSEWDRIRRFEA
jgi:hypothetical protein